MGPTPQVHVLASAFAQGLGECFMLVRFLLPSAGDHKDPSKVPQAEDVQFKLTELWFLAREARDHLGWGISSCATMKRSHVVGCCHNQEVQR